VLTDWVHIAVYFVFAAVLFAGAMFDFKTGFIPDGCAIIIAVLGAAVTVGAFVNPDVFDRFGQDLAAHLIGAVVISVPFLVLAFFGAMGVGDVLVMAAGGLLIGYSIIPAAFIGIFVGAIEGVIIKLGKFKEPESELETALRQLEEKLAALEQSKNERRSLTDFVNSSRDNEIEIKRVKREIEDAKRELETDDHPKGTVFRFIPALAFGLIVAYLFGGNIIDWYLNVFMQVE
jgi:prepilin signal peptidase PulO-like enzyme (type II secretory pathway)